MGKAPTGNGAALAMVAAWTAAADAGRDTGNRSKKLDPLAIRLDPATRPALEQLATADDRSLSDCCRRVLARACQSVGQEGNKDQTGSFV